MLIFKGSSEKIKDTVRLNTNVFSRVHATLQLALSVGQSVGWSVGQPHFTLVTSNMAPAHPHATSVAVYSALLLITRLDTRQVGRGRESH